MTSTVKLIWSSEDQLHSRGCIGWMIKQSRRTNVWGETFIVDSTKWPRRPSKSKLRSLYHIQFEFYIDNFLAIPMFEFATNLSIPILHWRWTLSRDVTLIFSKVWSDDRSVRLSIIGEFEKVAVAVDSLHLWFLFQMASKFVGLISSLSSNSLIRFPVLFCLLFICQYSVILSRKIPPAPYNLCSERFSRPP